jgi:hypothetical protein
LFFIIFLSKIDTNINTLFKTIDGVKHKLVIEYDEYAESPRERGTNSKLCIREHRRYNFPNEMNWDRASDEDPRQHLDTYHVFFLDCYEHSSITFSLS